MPRRRYRHLSKGLSPETEGLPMRFLRHSLTGLFLLALTLALVLWAGAMVRDAVEARMARDPGTPPARERIFAVPVQLATPETIVPTLSAYGQVQARRSLELRAAVSGQVIEIAPEMVEGGEVAAGQVLLRIDPANAEDALARAQADLADAEAETRDAARGLTLARADQAAAEEQAALRTRAFQRQKDLSARGVGTEAATEAAELAASSSRQAALSRSQAVAQAEARVDQAATRLSRVKIALAESERRLADTTVTAPFAGTLSGVTLVEGRLVTQNERLAALVDGTQLEAAVRLSTAQYVRLLDDEGRLVARPAKITLDLWGTALTTTGMLTRASAETGDGQTGRLVFAQIDAARGLKPGDFVTVSVEEPAIEQVVRLPATALDSSGTVLALSADERLEALPVRLERRQGDEVLVRGAELAGREVVAERSPLLGAGVKVRALREEGIPAPEAPALVELTPERRAKLVAFIEGNKMMPADVRERILGQLQEPQVPANMVERIESRMGG
jgi:multidrug efflux pump subunit AcrA (membrane-fusion protein)